MKQTINRRDFLSGLGTVVTAVAVAVQTAPLTYAFETLSDNRKLGDDSALVGDGFLRVKSGRARYFPSPTHVHTFDIPMSVFKDPPAEGMHFVSTESEYPFHHKHKLKLSQVQIMSIAMGEQVVINDSVFDHRWIVKLPSAVVGV